MSSYIINFRTFQNIMKLNFIYITQMIYFLSLMSIDIYLLITYGLIDWLFTDFTSGAQEIFSYMETSPLPVKGCKI
jgi:hypothetical protein